MEINGYNMHYHLEKFRCLQCTVEQAAFILCNPEICLSMIPCIVCKQQEMLLLDNYPGQTDRPFIVPEMIEKGQMWSLRMVEGEITLNRLKEKLGIK